MINRDAHPEHRLVPPRAQNLWAKPANDRGKQLLHLVNELNLVITNGRKDGSDRHPEEMLTYCNDSHNPPHRSMIDYVLLPLHLSPKSRTKSRPFASSYGPPRLCTASPFRRRTNLRLFVAICAY